MAADRDIAATDIGHWLAVEFALREVMDEDEAAAGACELKELGFQVVAPVELRDAALRREAMDNA